MATKTRKKRVLESAVDAVEELGEAATSFKETWQHVQKARGKGRTATTAAKRAGKKAWSTTKSGTKATTRAAKRAFSGKKRKKK